MPLTLYGLEKCSTCDKARGWLDARAIAHEFVDYRQNPIDPKLLRSWAAQLGWETLVNRASMTWRGLADTRKQPGSEDDWLALVRDYPALIKRPLIVGEDGVSVGFTEKQFGKRFGG
jgi:Spx/MgsR family transcriptional regulator